MERGSKVDSWTGRVTPMAVGTLLLGLLTIVAGCGSGGSSDGGTVTPPSGVSADFQPDNPAPGSETVALLAASMSGDTVQLEVAVTDVADVYGAAFDVVFDASAVAFLSWSPGDLLEDGGQTPLYFVQTATPGRLVVGAQRSGSVPGATASGTRTLIRLTFRVLRAGSFPIQFEAASLSDSQLPPQAIPGIAWYGGTLIGG